MRWFPQSFSTLYFHPAASRLCQTLSGQVVLVPSLVSVCFGVFSRTLDLLITWLADVFLMSLFLLLSHMDLWKFAAVNSSCGCQLCVKELLPSSPSPVGFFLTSWASSSLLLLSYHESSRLRENPLKARKPVGDSSELNLEACNSIKAIMFSYFSFVLMEPYFFF